MNTKDRKHARLAPSKLKNLELSPQWIQDKNQDEHPLTEAGTRMHEALETGNDKGLSEEELALVQKCREFTAQFQGEKFQEIELEIEDGCWGYADLVFIDGSIATLVDYKFGLSQQEDVETNPAAQAYVLGIFNAFQPVVQVNVYYLYPRLDTVSHAIYTHAAMPQIRLRLSAIEARIKSGKCEPHYETCMYCGHKPSCTYLKQFALPIATRYADSHDLQIPDEYDPGQITDPKMMSKAMACAQVLERWVESVKFHALKLRQEGGQEIPGYDMRSRTGRKKIVSPLQAWEWCKNIGITQEEFLAACDVSFRSLADAAGKTAPKGGKKKAEAALENGLRDAGLLEIGPDTYYLQRSKS